MFSRSLWADSIILSIMLIDNVMASTLHCVTLDRATGVLGLKVETAQLRWEYLLSFGVWQQAPLYQPPGLLLHTHRASGRPLLLDSNLLHCL